MAVEDKYGYRFSHRNNWAAAENKNTMWIHIGK
jgi:hypothetical protein